MTTVDLLREDPACDTRFGAGLTPVTENPEPSRQQTGQELSAITARLGLSMRELADQIGVDRETIKRVFEGDPTVRERKWAEVDAKIRALDEEMGSERHKEPVSLPSPDDIVEIRATGNFGVDIVVRGPVSDLPQLEDAVFRLVKRMGGSAGGSADGNSNG